jgi:hypothetical protein
MLHYIFYKDLRSLDSSLSCEKYDSVGTVPGSLLVYLTIWHTYTVKMMRINSNAWKSMAAAI